LVAALHCDGLASVDEPKGEANIDTISAGKVEASTRQAQPVSAAAVAESRRSPPPNSNIWPPISPTAG
jgi:hypothetical protein